MYNLKKATLEFTDFDIAKIEAAHDLLIENGYDLDDYPLRNLRDLTLRMYIQLTRE